MFRRSSVARSRVIPKIRLATRSWLSPKLDLLEDRCVPAAFTPGNLVIYRVGDGAAGLSNTGAAVFLDEYTPAGTLVQSVAMPTTVSGSNRQLIASGTATSEGGLTRSDDGQYLLLTGYGRDLGGSGSVVSTASATVNRIVGRVAADGTIDTSTALTDFADGNNPRSAVSTDGTDLWIAGGAGGARYTTLGSTTSTQLSTTIVNLRFLKIFDGQLYTSANSGTVRVATVGTGLPTTSGQTISNLPGVPTSGSPYGYFFADLDDSVAGYDTLYVAYDDASALTKFSLVGGSWTSNGTIGVAADAYRGLTGTVSSGTVTLYATRRGGSGAAGGGEFVSVVDASGYNGAFSATPTLLATAATNTAFRGIAFAPVSGSDTTPPTITSIETIVPNPRNSPVSTIDVTFSEPINLATFTVADIALTRDAAPVAFSGNETFTFISGTTYRIGGLAEETGTQGVYVFSVDPTGIQDLAGNPGVGAPSATSWTVDTTGPTIVAVETIVPDPRSTPVATIDVEFDQPIDLSTFTIADLNLTRNSSPVTFSGNETFTFVSGNIYRVGGLSEETSADGVYVFTVNAAGIEDPVGNLGSGSANTGWTKFTADTTPPTVAALFFDGSAWTPTFRGAAGDATYGYPAQTGAGQLTTLPWNNLNRFTVQFSEALSTALTTSDVEVLGTNAGTIAGLTITQLDSLTYRITLPANATTDFYLFRIFSANVEDAAGNKLAGTFTEGVSTFPTGGSANVNFVYRFRVAVGDADRNGIVRNPDVNLVRANLFNDFPSGTYSIYYDVTGDGQIRNADVNAVRANLFNDPPGTGPSRPVRGGQPFNGDANGSSPLPGNRASGRITNRTAAIERNPSLARRVGSPSVELSALDAYFAEN